MRTCWPATNGASVPVTWAFWPLSTYTRPPSATPVRLRLSLAAAGGAGGGGGGAGWVSVGTCASAAAGASSATTAAVAAAGPLIPGGIKSCDQASPHPVDRDTEKDGGQNRYPKPVPQNGQGVRVEDEGPADLDQVVERREPGHHGRPVRQLVERVEDAAEEEQRRDEERVVVRVQLHARGQRREGHAEHREA